MTANQLPQMKLRLPFALKQWVKDMAAQNRRSENGEVIFHLEQCKAREEAKQGATA
jgi:hypothetical protein